MHATIRWYEGVVGTTEELAEAARQLASTLSQSRGFVSWVVLKAEAGVFATVSIFEDRTSLGQADQVAEASLLEQWGRLISEDPQVISGEIVFQRGL